ncbi:dihydrofolate reductase family protein [Thalassococcus sp. BH17M4-6]|uniref:dihydrofolate reductase family protein n=1 Tax=Thalassococcus sp. BH17M4-6 TaxID=3413148 RepID=UPI003BCE71A3
MHPVIYDVAVSIDGYISGPGGDISGFAQDGAVVDDYRDRLSRYATAIMGRATYEFGYRFGMAPGQNPYGHMRTFVFSATIDLPAKRDVTVMRGDLAETLARIVAQSRGPVYLCGGGAFAGSLLALGLIDILRLKRAPVVLGGGVPLFGPGRIAPRLTLLTSHPYADGGLFQEYAIGPAQDAGRRQSAIGSST